MVDTMLKEKIKTFLEDNIKLSTNPNKNRLIELTLPLFEQNNTNIGTCTIIDDFDDSELYEETETNMYTRKDAITGRDLITPKSHIDKREQLVWTMPAKILVSDPVYIAAEAIGYNDMTWFKIQNQLFEKAPDQDTKVNFEIMVMILLIRHLSDVQDVNDNVKHYIIENPLYKTINFNDESLKQMLSQHIKFDIEPMIN